MSAPAVRRSLRFKLILPLLAGGAAITLVLFVLTWQDSMKGSLALRLEQSALLASASGRLAGAEAGVEAAAKSLIAESVEWKDVKKVSFSPADPERSGSTAAVAGKGQGREGRAAGMISGEVDGARAAVLAGGPGRFVLNPGEGTVMVIVPVHPQASEDASGRRGALEITFDTGQDSKRALFKAARFSGVAAGAFALLAVVMAGLYRAMITRPLAAVARTLARREAGGGAPAVAGDDEIGLLARTARESFESLAEEGGMLTSIADSLPAFIAYVDGQGRYRFVNTAYQNFFQKPRDAFTGKLLSEIHGPEWYGSVRRHVESALSGQRVSFEHGVEDDTGNTHHLRGSFVPKTGREGERPEGFYVVFHDITDLREGETTLRSHQERTKVLVQAIEACSAGISLSDPEGEDLPLTYVNQAFCEITGYAREEVLGQNCRFLQGPETDREVTEKIKRAIEERKKIEVEFINYRKDGTPFWNTLSISPVFDLNAKLLAFIAVQQDVSAWKKAEADLARAKEEAETASRTKDAFLANISHEIRTPLNGIIATASLLSQSPLSGDQQTHISNIVQSGEMLQTLLGDVLDFSRIEAGKMVFSLEDFGLRPLLESTFLSFEPAARQKGLGYEMAFDPALEVRVSGDPVRLRQIAGNLLSNAIKFTKTGSVKMTVAKRQDFPGAGPSGVGFTCTIEDTGAGIDEADKPRIFEKFFQSESLSGSGLHASGTGLGLAICKSLVAMMGGEIGFESEAGGGSRFWFSLSLKSATGTAPTKIVKGELPLFEGRVLLAEDMEANRFVITSMLEKLGCTVDHAANGSEALEKAKGGAYTVILMDVRMPVMDGLKATRALREAGCATPVIALTAFAVKDSEKACLQSGMSSFLPKPLRMETLAGALARYLPQREGEVAAPISSPDNAPPAKPTDRIPQTGKPPVSAEPPAFDPSFFDSLARRDPDAAARFAALALGDSARLIDEIEGALGNGGAQNLSDLAHALKSVCAQAGASALSASAEKLELAAAEGDMQTAASLALSLGELYARMRPELERYAAPLFGHGSTKRNP